MIRNLYTPPPPSEAQSIADATEKLLEELLALPLSQFLAGEFAWLLHWNNKARFATTAEHERQLQNNAAALLAMVKSRGDRQ